jgi:hypothetical protein
MSEVHNVLPGEPPHARHRLPRRTKAKSYDAEGTDISIRRSAVSNKNSKSETSSFGAAS